MSLEEKVMYLYEDILEPEKERKIILLLKYLVIDKETDIDKITNEIGIKKSFVEKIINDDNIMLQYLNEVELKEIRFRMDILLNKNSKLIRFIKIAIKEKETNIERIKRLVPIRTEMIVSYVENKNRILKYITEEEYNYLVNLMTPIMVKKTQIEKLIEVVMTSGETDLEKIEKQACVKRDLTRNCIRHPELLEKYLSQADIEIFVNRLRKMLEEIEFKEYEKDKKYVGQIINDIFDTRHLYGDICAKHLFSREKFEKYLYDEEYMKKEFPKITVKIIKGKIKENEKIRMKRPYNMFLIEDKFCVMISKKDVYYLNQFDAKRLNVASYYLGTGANLDATCEYFKMSIPEVFAMLFSPKLDEILNEQYCVVLKHCLNIENILNKNDLNAKKIFTNEITKFLETNNYDMQLAMQYYNIPEPLFNRIIKEIKKLPYASDLTKQNLQDALNIETQVKSK